jgi:hypothetical protein
MAAGPAAGRPSEPLAPRKVAMAAAKAPARSIAPLGVTLAACMDALTAMDALPQTGHPWTSMMLAPQPRPRSSSVS